MIPYDRIVLLGFGGPEAREDVRPFLGRVLKGRNVPPERVESVALHYEEIGGTSPFNAWTRLQAAGLGARLRELGSAAPVEAAYLYAEPYASELAHRIEGERVLAIVLASFQSPASWDRYKVLPNARYAPPIVEHPLFVRAYAERLRQTLPDLTPGVPPHAIFTAHSIPKSMADASPYAAQFEACAGAIAAAAGVSSWEIAYQSRSGSPNDPWLEPDIRETVEQLPQRGIREVVAVPIGFLCDHVEVLYDLDVDASRIASEAGVRFVRAPALNDHPLFIDLLADLVVRCAA